MNQHITGCLLLNLFVIFCYLCLFNLIRWCYAPGGTYTQWWYYVMVSGYLIVLCLYDFCGFSLQRK